MGISSYDPCLFTGTAAYYDRYRFPYPEDFFTKLQIEMAITHEDRLMDLGCGTGQLTFPFSPIVKEVIGIDPDEEMIEVARSKLIGFRLNNVRFQLGSSWDIPLDDTIYDAAIMGESFHWMDRKDVLNRLAGMLPARGNVAVISRKFDIPEEVRTTIEDTRIEFLGPERRAGNGSYAHPQLRHEDILLGSPFSLVSECISYHEILIDINHLIGFQFSTSYGASRHFGEQRKEYEHTLRSRLGALLPDATVRIPAQAKALVGKRPDLVENRSK